ncbi:hypothetical protein MLD38_016121 [Melastoma candidum]|uniref:Uncharacterized protein n=1 Tax=Melastoma candidum TaxID=119954 RepID=A0ACB9RII5_9MYRT|nr:hypothetical protein MLD38_016121 [Melastoma candidum]
MTMANAPRLLAVVTMAAICLLGLPDHAVGYKRPGPRGPVFVRRMHESDPDFPEQVRKRRPCTITGVFDENRAVGG